MNRLGKHLAIWGSLLQLGIVAGIVVSFIQMDRAMKALNPSDTASLTAAIGAMATSSRASTVGLLTALIGGLLLMGALFGCHYRAPWLHSVLCASTLFWLFAAFPVGLMMLAYVICDRKSFRPSPKGEAGADPTEVLSHGVAEAQRED